MNTTGFDVSTDSGAANLRVGELDSRMLSFFDYEQDPNVWPIIYEQYPNQLGLLHAMRMMGMVDRIPLKNTSLSVFYRSNLQRPLKLGAQIATTAKEAPFTVEIDHDEYFGGTSVLQVGSTFLIPGKYLTNDDIAVLTQGVAYVKSVSGTGTSEVFTCQLLNSKTAISTAVPNGTELVLGGTIHGRGTKQPKGHIRGTLVKDFTTSLMKQTLEITGGIQSTSTFLDKMNALYVDGSRTKSGNGGYLYRALVDEEILFDAAKDIQVIAGERNTNLIEQAAGDHAFNKTSTLLSGDGIMPLMDAGAQKMYYDTEFGMYQLDDVVRILESQSISTRDVAILAGSNFDRTLENSGVEWLRANSQGTSFLNSYGDVGVMFKSFYKNGVNFHKHVMKGLSNPFSYGVDETYSNLAMFIPFGNYSNATINEETIKLNNLELLHTNYNGENRTNVIGKVFGMNGLGESIVNQYDAGSYNMLSEFMVMMMNINQTILLRKQ